MKYPLLLFLVRNVFASPFRTRYSDGTSHRPPAVEPGSPEFWEKLIISAALVLAGGVFAGYVSQMSQPIERGLKKAYDRLTLGLMGLDELHLRVLSTSSDDPVEQENARKGSLSVAFTRTALMNILLVLELMRKGRHWILVVSSSRYVSPWMIRLICAQVLLLCNVVSDRPCLVGRFQYKKLPIGLPGHQ